MAQQHHRIYTFDLLRGIAVLTMMLAHSVYFFHDRSSVILLGIEGLGNTVSFTVFLLVAGAVAFVAYSGSHQATGQIKRKRILNRVLLLLLAYYFLALFMVSGDILRAEGFARLRLIFDILLFRHLPGFTEYFPPFIFYSALLSLFPRFFLTGSRTVMRLVIVSIAALTTGFVLYRLPVGDFWQPWLALIAGAEGVYRFPLLQYLPVFLLGLYWGKRTMNHEGLSAKQVLCSRLFWLFALIAGATLIGSYIFNLGLPTIFSRWPPAIPFLALGLGFAFLIASLLYFSHQLRRLTLARNLLLLLGQNALGLFWSHIFLLSLYAMAAGPKVSSLIVFIFLWLLLLLLSLALTTFLPFNFRLALTSIRGSHEEQEEILEEEAVFRLSKDVATEAILTTRGIRRFFFPNRQTVGRRKFRKRHKLGISVVALAIGAMVFPATTEEIALQRQERGADIWWSNVYAYRQPVTLTNPESFITLDTGTPVSISFNHFELVEQGKSRADGRDVRLVYWTGNEHLVAESTVVNPAGKRAELHFRLPIQIKGGQADQYFSLYYDGFALASSTANAFDGPTEMKADFHPEEPYPLIASVSSKWRLIGVPDNDTITLNITSSTPHQLETVTYQILDTDLAGTMLRSSDSSWEADIPVATLQPGAYRIQATLTEGAKELKSHETGFYRSHPLYVAWTQDWEGYDVNQAHLDAIEAIADQFQLPITHFFNPRIYVTDTIKTERAMAITRWVKQRLEMGDGFGLHLHLFLDFVEQAGITPRTEPNWGDSGNGYGVPLAAYTKAEQFRLIQNAGDLLVAFGFRRPDIFRAGGWYANQDTLAALEDLGYRADSSARTKYQFGRNKLPGSWDIASTAKPYYPSRTNQNRSSTTNSFTVLEIPDNGADSYAFSAQAMIDRFTANLGDGILKENQQVTYLSHPHWFDDKEQARVRELFTYISRYAFAADQGPVIFTTTNAIADVWTNE